MLPVLPIRIVLAAGLAALLTVALFSSAQAAGAGATHPEPALSRQATDPSAYEQVLMLPVLENGQALQFQTTVFKPPGAGPFPLLLMNHGKDRGNPALQARDRFLALSREFVARGYAVVIPMRKGFAQSEGRYTDSGCNMTGNGEQQADDIAAALTAVLQQPWVDKDRIIIAGQSYGGLATLAFGKRDFPGVRGLLNFAGGLRIDGERCNWRSALLTAAKNYGVGSRSPSLWFYGMNDSFFDPSLAQQMQAAYQAAGAPSQLVVFGNFKRDAHGMVGSREGVAIWWPETERFLKSIGMPTDIVFPLEPTPRLPATQFAPLWDTQAVPYVSERGRAGYREYLTKAAPRAFAISSSGAWSWAEEGDDPSESALSTCQKHSQVACQLYSVDSDVVWSAVPSKLALQP
jgi:dienelactone hydrolase